MQSRRHTSRRQVRYTVESRGVDFRGLIAVTTFRKGRLPSHILLGETVIMLDNVSYPPPMPFYMCSYISLGTRQIWIRWHIWKTIGTIWLPLKWIIHWNSEDEEMMIMFLVHKKMGIHYTFIQSKHNLLHVVNSLSLYMYVLLRWIKKELAWSVTLFKLMNVVHIRHVEKYISCRLCF